MTELAKEHEHTTSYYAATANDIRLRPTINEHIEADVCVIGAGYTGLSSALHLAEQGFKVVVLEAHRIGWGASGRNGGQMVSSYSRDVDVIEAKYGQELAKTLGSMAFEGADIIRQRIDQYQIQCDYRPGNLFAAFNARQQQELIETQERWARYGNNNMTLIEGDDVQQYVNSEAYHSILIDHHGGHIHPLNLALGEARAIEQLGGQIFEQSAVIALERSEKPVIKTAHGQVTANTVVLAGNAYLGGLVPELASKTMPCGTQIVTTEVLGEELANSLIPSGMAVEDCNYKLNYYRTTADHRLLFGGGVTYGGGDPASIEGFLRPHIEKVFPQIKGVKIEYRWGGDFLLTLSRLPMFGRLTPNIYYAQGYSGHGVCTTHLAGKLIAEAVTADSSRFDAFASLPHLPFPGGRLFRVPYTAIGALYYGLRDRLGI